MARSPALASLTEGTIPEQRVQVRRHHRAHRSRSLSAMATDLAPRERLLRHGAQGLSDAELLAVLLPTSSPRIPALAVAERLLDASAGLAGHVGADQRDLRSHRRY